MLKVLDWIKSLLGMRQKKVTLDSWLIGDHIRQTTRRRRR